MEQKITKADLENPQRFVGEGLGAPDPGEDLYRGRFNVEAKAQPSAGCFHP